MDMETRAELEKLHGRINEVKDRVTILETNMPHINSALARIQGGVDRLNGHISKGVWAIFLLFLAVVVKFTVDGGWTKL